MENLWRAIKYHIRNLHPQNLKKLGAAIHLVWKELPKNLAEELVKSMPKI